MIKHEVKDYLTVEEYKIFSQTLRVVTGLLMFSIQQHELTTKRTIIRNFMSKSIASLQGIFALWEIKNYQDCYVLLRVIADRLFHLHDLIENDSFEVFDDWAFYQQFCARNKTLSDQEFNKKIIKQTYEANKEQKARFKRLTEDKPSYKRPKPEKAAKSLGLDFVYDYGYDHASTLVHPMANDGFEDFVILTGLYPDVERPDHRSVLSNGSLYTFLVLNNSMLGSGLGFKWKKEVVEFMDSCMDFFKDGKTDYQVKFMALSSLPPETILCRENSE